MFNVCLSGRARNFKRKAKSSLLFVYPARPGNLKEVKSCLLFVYPIGLGNLKGLKVVNCLFILQDREV